MFCQFYKSTSLKVSKICISIERQISYVHKYALAIVEHKEDFVDLVLVHVRVLNQP